MSQDRPPVRSPPFQIGDLVRLNEELKQIRDVLKRKKSERELAKRQGKRIQLNLAPEIERLSRFLTDLESASVKLSTQSPLPGAKPGETNALRDVLGKVKTEMENEKQKLEAERDAREKEKQQHQLELERLRNEIQKNKELLDTNGKSIGAVVVKTLEESQKIQAESSEPTEPQKPPGAIAYVATAEVIAERPPQATQIDLAATEPKPAQEEKQLEERHETVRPPPEQILVKPPMDDEITNYHRVKVADEFVAIRSELQRVREQISREQDSLEQKRKDLELQKRGLEEDRRTLEAKIADTFSATRSELQRLREEIARKQETLDARQKAIYEERVKVDEEKRLLKERLAEAENERLRFMSQKMMEELQDERSELTGLKKSLQQLRTESARERRRVERDRESILRARFALENEKREVAWKKALMEIKARSIQATPRPPKKTEKPEKQPAPEAIKGLSDKATATASSGLLQHSEEGVAVLGVRLGQEDYGIDISRVREIMKKHTITTLPRQPAYVEGVMNVRGTIIPVVNLRRRFDLKGEPSQNPHTVIVDSTEGMVGILVDSVTQVIRIPQDRIHPPPPITSGLDGEYILGICKVNDQLLLYLDLEKVLRKATPIASVQQGIQMLSSTKAARTPLNPDEQKLLKLIPPTGIIKTRLQRKTRFAETRLMNTISSLVRKRLVKIHKDGNRRLILRATGRG